MARTVPHPIAAGRSTRRLSRVGQGPDGVSATEMGTAPACAAVPALASDLVIQSHCGTARARVTSRPEALRYATADRRPPRPQRRFAGLTRTIRYRVARFARRH